MGASCSCLFGERSRLEVLSQVQEKGADNSNSVAGKVEVGMAKGEVVADSKGEGVVDSEKDTSVPATPAITVVPVSSPVKATASPSTPPTTAKDTADAPAIQPAKTAAVPTPVAPACPGSAQKDEIVAAHNGKQTQERPADVTTAAGDVQEEEEDNDVEQEVHTSGKKKRRRRKKKGGSKDNSSEVSGSHVDNKQASTGNKSKVQDGQAGAGNKKASGKVTVK